MGTFTLTLTNSSGKDKLFIIDREVLSAQLGYLYNEEDSKPICSGIINILEAISKLDPLLNGEIK